MAIDTLFDLAKADAEAFGAERAVAQNTLTTALADATKAQDDLAKASTELAGLQDDATRIRRDIAATTIAADGAALFVKLDKKTTEIRAKQAQMLDLQTSLGEAEARVSAAQGQAEASAAEEQAAVAAKQAAKDLDDTHASWKAAAAAAPLSTLPDAADVSTPGASKTAKDDAAKRLDGANGGDIPEKLFDQAETRRAKQLARISQADSDATAAEDALATKQADAGLRGKSEQARLAYERSEAALRDYVSNARERYQAALSSLAQVKQSTALNADEKKRIDDLKTAGEAAIAKQTDLITAQEAVDAKRDEVEVARLAAVNANPTVDPDTVAAVQTKLNAIPALETTRNTKRTAYEGVKADLDAWEAAVPEATWALFDTYRNAVETLDELAAVDPALLASTLDANEKAYAQALAAERANARVVIALTALTASRRGRAGAATQAAPARLLGALRGDD